MNTSVVYPKWNLMWSSSKSAAQHMLRTPTGSGVHHCNSWMPLSVTMPAIRGKLAQGGMRQTVWIVMVTNNLAPKLIKRLIHRI